MSPRQRSLAVGAALVTVWVLWGSTYLGIHVVVAEAPPLLSAGFRFLVAGLALLGGTALWRRRAGGERLTDALRGNLGGLTLLGLLHFTVANGLVSIASQTLHSSAAGLLFATVPVWILLIGVVARQGRAGAADYVSVVVGLLGVVVLLGFQPGSMVASGGVLLAAVTWALAGTVGAGRPWRERLEAVDVVSSSGVQMVAGGTGLLLAAVASEDLSRFSVFDVTPQAWLAEGYLVVGGSMVGFIAYNVLFALRADPRLIGTFSYVNPLIAVVLGVVVLGEPAGTTLAVGTCLVTLSVFVTIRSTSRSAREGADGGLSTHERTLQGMSK